MNDGPLAGKIAVIAEIIDHNRVRLIYIIIVGIEVYIHVGNHRWSYEWYSPPSLPLQTPSSHPSQTHKTSPCCRNGNCKKISGTGGYCREVGQVCVGAKTGDEGEAEVTE